MIVVSNTSPITNLAAIERLNLLQALYGTIIIPQAVYIDRTFYPNLISAIDLSSISLFQNIDSIYS